MVKEREREKIKKEKNIWTMKQTSPMIWLKIVIKDFVLLFFQSHGLAVTTDALYSCGAHMGVVGLTTVFHSLSKIPFLMCLSKKCQCQKAQK